jgi:hypothetical protein
MKIEGKPSLMKTDQTKVENKTGETKVENGTDFCPFIFIRS